MSMVTFTLDGKEYTVPKGTTVLETARQAEIDIPTMCYHEEMQPYGSCRLCLVEVVKRGWASIQPACLYPAQDGIEVITDSERVLRTRKVMFELFLARIPDNDNIKAFASRYGVNETRFKLPKTSDCALCGLCVRACEQISQRHAINFANRGRERTIQTPFADIAEVCVGCKVCAHLCPTRTIVVDEAD